MGISEADAEEIAQDTLMKVYANVGMFKRTGRAQFTTWVIQIAKNLALDSHRKVGLNKQSPDGDFVPAVSQGQPADRNRPFLLWLRDELAKLPPDDQQILLWREGDHSYEEIAKWLGIKVVTARVRHKRAKDRIIEAANRADPLGSIGVHDEVESGALYE